MTDSERHRWLRHAYIVLTVIGMVSFGGVFVSSYGVVVDEPVLGFGGMAAWMAGLICGLRLARQADRVRGGETPRAR